jgi:peptidyl-prolyl cis-trans isomerase C
VAEVNNEKITVRDFQEFLDRNPVGYRTADEEFQGKRKLLDSLISHTLLAQAGYERHVEQSLEILRIMEANRMRFLLDGLYYFHVDQKLAVSEAELRKLYDDMGYQVRPFHIFVHNADTANMIFEKLKAGADFEQMAYQYSADPAAKRNRGDMGYFVRGTAPEEFERVVFSLEVGEISPPFQTNYGYHIVKLIEKQPTQSREEYAQVRPSLEQELKTARRQELTAAYFDSIAVKYPITVDTAVANYVTHKRTLLYPPQVVDRLPKSDFDEEQLDRDEKELILATWNGGQISLIDYLMSMRRYLAPEDRPNFDNYDSMAVIIFQLKRMDILAHEAEVEKVDQTDYYKRKSKLFEQYSVAEIMKNDSIPVIEPPSEQEMRDYYDLHREEYLVPAQVRLFEILVSDQMLAQRLVREISNIDQFQARAYQLSERAGLRVKRGDLGYVDSLHFPVQYHAARQVPVNTIGGPITDRGKYSIIWPINWTTEHYEDFLNLKEDITEQLTTEKRNQMVLQWLEKRRSSSDIEVHDDVIWSMIDREMYASAGNAAGKP